MSAIRESYKTKRRSYGSTLPHSAMTQAWYQRIKRLQAKDLLGFQTF